MPLNVVLFDMDGTLVEARDAAWKIFSETDRAFGLGIDTQEKFLQLSESNFFRAIADYCDDSARAEAVVTHFMDTIRQSYNPPFIPGIVDIIKALSDEVEMAILSSNMLDVIRRILAAGDVTNCFPHILAGDDEPSKSVAIAHYLRIGTDYRGTSSMQVGDAPVWRADEVALVTDTVGDVGEGRTSGLRVCGVSWGMHTADQLRAAGAEFVADTPLEFLDWFKQARQGAMMRS
ncbi:MAG: phosphoglycolate phosphatase [Gammaproteobacteria bacterium]|jgi:phosphoglycolate phosphatase